MRNFLIAILASTILILPAFAQNNQGGRLSRRPLVRPPAPAFRFLPLVALGA
jgi:hypothetical protein